MRLSGRPVTRSPSWLCAGWLGSLEEVALAATTSPVPRESVVELLVEGLIADLERAGRLNERQSGAVGRA